MDPELKMTVLERAYLRHQYEVEEHSCLFVPFGRRTYRGRVLSRRRHFTRIFCRSARQG